MSAREADLLHEALAEALRAADPTTATRLNLPPPPKGRLMVVGAGKAAASMALAAEQGYRGRARPEGLVITSYGHALPTERVEVLEAAHPVPDEAGVAATRKLLDLVKSAGEDDLVLCLLSGGGSALACAPSGLTLDDKASLTRELLAAGADIHSMNAVRKHLSKVKGGWLAAVSGAPVVTLAVSDVVGDDPATIASGPTVADETTFQQALEVVTDLAPGAAAARAALEAGLRGERPETPKPGDERLEESRFVLVASGADAVGAAVARLRAAGVVVLAEDPLVTGDSAETALRQADEVKRALAAAPAGEAVAFVYGGETTVNRRTGRLAFGMADGRPVEPPVSGGPNGEWALAFASAMSGGPPMWLLAVDTDGIDGDSDAAGALLGPRQLSHLSLVQVADYLRRHDSHTLLSAVGGLVSTGPTRTNVNALRIALFPPRA